MSIDTEHTAHGFGRRLMVVAIAFLAVGLVKFAVRHHFHARFLEEGSQPYGD